MQTSVVDRVLHDHEEICARLSDWEAALAQLIAPAFADSQRGLERLWQLVPFFEKEVARHFREEEAEFFPRVEANSPGRDTLLRRFAGEHADFTRQWRAYKIELLYCDAVGETRRLSELGATFIRQLRQHMRREEAELLPLIKSS